MLIGPCTACCIPPLGSGSTLAPPRLKWICFTATGAANGEGGPPDPSPRPAKKVRMAGEESKAHAAGEGGQEAKPAQAEQVNMTRSLPSLHGPRGGSDDGAAGLNTPLPGEPGATGGKTIQVNWSGLRWQHWCIWVSAWALQQTADSLSSAELDQPRVAGIVLYWFLTGRHGTVLLSMLLWSQCKSMHGVVSTRPTRLHGSTRS